MMRRMSAWNIICRFRVSSVTLMLFAGLIFWEHSDTVKNIGYRVQGPGVRKCIHMVIVYYPGPRTLATGP